MPSPPRRSPSVVESDATNPLLPNIFCDPFASFAPTEMEIDAFDQTWVIPRMTARDWLEILWDEQLTSDMVFPGLVRANETALEALLAGEVTAQSLFDTAMEVIELASGFKWWFALNLVTVLKASWMRLGGSILPLVQAEDVSLGAWLTIGLGVCTERVDPKKLAEFLNNLNTPPAGISANVAFDEESEAEAFLAAMRQSL